MSKLLYMIASPRGEQSESTAAANAFLEAYRQRHPDLEVDTLNLWEDPLPIFGGKGVAAKMTVFGGQAPTGEQAEAWAEVQRVFARFDAADRYLFAVPMWNAGVPWVLKHFIDTITQPGMVFGFDPAAGYQPLLTGKKAAIIYTSGVYAPGVPKAFGTDFHAEFFDDWLRFCGITDIHEARFQPTVLTGDPVGDRAAAHARARQLAATFDEPAVVAA
ncbi:MAG: FMN-dependent NADH-azoreductase [Thermoleophilaceae bacterium]